MKRILYPDDSSAAPAPGSSPARELPDFRRWLAAVQLGLRTGPGSLDISPPVDDGSTRPPGESTEFPTQKTAPDQSF